MTGTPILDLTMARRTFEEFKPEIDQALQYLKTCDNFTTDEAKESLNVLKNAGFRSRCSNVREVARHLTGQGFGQLFAKIWNSLREHLDRDKWRQCGYTNLASLASCCENYTENCPELGAELGKHGCIPLLLASLERVKAYFNQQSEFKTIQSMVSNIFGILHHSIRLCSGNREIYRNVGAVDSINAYLKQSSNLVSAYALMTLAYIVNEGESKILAESDRGIAVLVKLLQDSVESSHHEAIIYHSFSLNAFSTLQLADCLNQLAINDDNKLAIEREGGIPTIIRMLQDEGFTEDEQTVASEILWNLTFVDSIRQSDRLQDALPGKRYGKDIQW